MKTVVKKTQVQTQEEKSWKPDDYLFDENDSKLNGRISIENYLKQRKIIVGSKVLTSLDFSDLKVALKVDYMPKGITQHQIPFFFNSNNLSGFVECEPNVNCPNHLHFDLNGFWLITRGSLVLNYEFSLKEGDWFYVPKECSYQFRTGDYGCYLFHVHDHPDTV
jgi:hypothetical protein